MYAESHAKYQQLKQYAMELENRNQELQDEKDFCISMVIGIA
jgi:cell division protein FtsB